MASQAHRQSKFHIPQPITSGSLMETFPWEPPDGGFLEDLGSRSVWVGVVASSSEFGASYRQVGGHGLEIPGREGDAHGAGYPGSDLEVEVAGSQEVQLDLGLTDITKYSSYSKLWRTLYFVNDAPFRIHNHGVNAAGEWTGPLSLII